MAQRIIIVTYILSIILFFTGCLAIGGGIYMIIESKQLINKPDTYAPAKDQIDSMIQDINKYPPVEIHDPPDLSGVNPQSGLHIQYLYRLLGIYCLVFGAVLCFISVATFTSTTPKCRNLDKVSVVASVVLLLFEVTVVVMYLAFPNVKFDILRGFFLKQINKEYTGLSGHDSVSMSWNLFMKMHNCCGVESYQDFNSSETFNDRWGGIFHTMMQLDKLAVPLICCNKIEIRVKDRYEGPCHEDHYTNKKGCVSVILHEIDRFNIYVVFAAMFYALLVILAIILICCTKYFNSSEKKVNPQKEDNVIMDNEHNH